MGRQKVVKQSWAAAVACLGVLSACAATPPTHDPLSAADHTVADAAQIQAKPRPKPPTPASVTIKEPGGDAADRQEAALYRQLDEAWGLRSDRDDQLLVPLADSAHWKRVRYWGVEHFVGFRYGNDHHLLVVGFVQEVPAGTPVTSEICMRRFEAWGRPQTKPFDVKFGPFAVHHQRWREQRLEVHAVDGEFSAAFSTTAFSAAWAAFPAYKDGCFIYAVAVPWRKHPEMARRVRDRWVKEAFTQVDPKTVERAVRKER